MKIRAVLLILAVPALALAAWGAKTAYEHRGFFVYQWELATSPERASNQKELVELVRQNPRQAFIRFREILAADPFSYNACHGIAHQMGHEAFEVFGFSQAMSLQDALCGGGYVHGVIEGRFGLLREKDILKELPTVCAETDETCYHGVGHGLMIATKLNEAKSLDYCDLLPAPSRRNCYDGVWMHIFDLEESGVRGRTDQLIPDEAMVVRHLARCATAPEAAKTSCYFYLPRIYAHGAEVRFADHVALCNRLEESARLTCAVGTGHSNMKYHIANPDASISQCQEFGEKALIDGCREGSTLYYLFAAEKPTDETCNAFSTDADRKLCRRVNNYREDL